MTKGYIFETANASVSELLRAYRAILAELKRRGVVRTLNAPTGDLAELLVARAFRGELAPNSEKSFDVIVPGGRLLQVKSRMLASGVRRERQLSTIRSWGFTHLVIVLFGPDFSVTRAALMSAEVAREQSMEDRHVRGNRIMATDALLNDERVEEITDLIVSALEGLDVDYA